MTLIPHADRVVQHNAKKECRWCGHHIGEEENYLGEADQPVPHIAWECTDCDFTIAELPNGGLNE